MCRGRALYRSQSGRCQIGSEPSSQAGAEGPQVILLGGVSGTGKTTIGNVLVKELGLSHHISTGFIRASISHLLPEAESRLLQRHTYDAYEALSSVPSADRSPLLEGAIQQSLLLKPAIEACIRRAVREGIGIVLEGSHFIPGVLDPAPLGASLLCVLDVPDREALKFRALSPNHSRRRLSEAQLARLMQLQEGILHLAQVHNQPVIINDDLERAVSRIKALSGVR